MSKDEEEEDAWAEAKSKRHLTWTEFDCPECSANNPYDEGFRVGDEVVCQYCGQPWRVRAKDDDKFRLVE